MGLSSRARTWLLPIFVALPFARAVERDPNHTPTTPRNVEAARPPTFAEGEEHVEERLKILDSAFDNKSEAEKEKKVGVKYDEPPLQIRGTASSDPLTPALNAWFYNFQRDRAEKTEYTGNDIQETIRDVRESGQLPDFTRKWMTGRLQDPKRKLEDDGLLERDAKVDRRETTVINIDRDTAEIGYALALYRLNLIRLKKEAAEKERVKETADAAARNAQLTNDQLSNSVRRSESDHSSFTANPLTFGQAAFLSTNYLDLAAKQITNSTAGRESGFSGVSSPTLTANPELNRLFENALNSANSLDLAGKNMQEQLKPFRDLINSKTFLENGIAVMGKDNAQALVASVQAADLLSGTGGKLNGTAVEYLANAFNMGTGLGAPPCIGCVESKDSSQVAQGENYQAASEEASVQSQNWIDEAFALVDEASKNKRTNQQELTALLKGRIELEKLLSELKLYKSSGVLDSLQIPPSQSIARLYKQATESAAGILFLVRQKRITAGDPVAKEKRFVKNSAGALLQKLKLTHSPGSVESTLRDFFENENQNETRAFWRRYEETNYKKLRSATAQIIMTRSLSLLKVPSFEKMTMERAALAYLVSRASFSVRDREAKRLKDQKLRLGLEKMSPIKMRGDTRDKRPASEADSRTLPLPVPDANRFPSFKDE